MSRILSEAFKQYLSGFFDGDGSITVEKLKESSYTLRIKFCQSNENWIQQIQKVYPFMHYDGGLRNNRQNNRCEYQLRAAGKQIEPLVNDLLKYSILKYEQLLEAKKFFQYINVKNTGEEKEKIYKKLKELKKESKLKPYERLSIPYIAGLFDAEGSIGIYSNSLRVKITQKSDIYILQKIADLYNNKNKIDNFSISFYGENSLQFLNDIKKHCIYKTPQISAAIDYINTLNCELTDDIKKQRKELQEIIKNEKLVDTSNYLFKNIESHKKYLRNCFNEFSKLSYNELLNYCKFIEIKNTKDFTKFENKIYNTPDWTQFNINPILEFCETNTQLQLYQYYRKKVSSLPLTGVVGRAIRILVKDSITNKYIGIMCLSSDVYNLGERDIYIKKTNLNIQDEWKKMYLTNIMNLSCCVPLQPFGFNTAGGKLLASLAFSKEVYNYHFNKYKEPLLAIITTSINGKSIQYDRLKCLKLIGYTKGYGSVNVPDELYSVCKEYNNIWKVIPKTNRIDRFNFLKNLLQHLGLSQNILLHNNKRGIYFGYLFSTKFQSKTNLDELQSVNEIYNIWKIRWCDNRIKNLLTKRSIKTSFNLYKEESFKDCIQFKLPNNVYQNINVNNKKDFTDNLIKEILSYKIKPVSNEEVCNILNIKYNINLIKNDITKIYTGKIMPKVEDEEYILLISNKNSKNKLTDEEIYYILNLYDGNSKKYSYSKIAEIFNSKYKKNITKGTVYDIISHKIKPNTSQNICNTTKFSLLNNEQLIAILKMKNQKMNTQEVSDYIKKNFNIYIHRNFISRLWKGENVGLEKDIINTKEYTDMLNNTSQRVVKSKFTDTELEFLKTEQGSYSEIVTKFFIKFNKSITRAYISKLRK